MKTTKTYKSKCKIIKVAHNFSKKGNKTVIFCYRPNYRS